MNGNRVTLITLGVEDLARAKAFYAELGFEAAESPPSVVFFPCGSYMFGLFPRAELAREQGRAPEDLRAGAISLSQNQPDRAGVEAAYARALRAGATALRAPFETEWGGYSCYISDPDGHVWEFSHNPFWPLTDAGHLE